MLTSMDDVIEFYERLGRETPNLAGEFIARRIVGSTPASFSEDVDESSLAFFEKFDLVGKSVGFLIFDDASNAGKCEPTGEQGIITEEGIDQDHLINIGSIAGDPILLAPRNDKEYPGHVFFQDGSTGFGGAPTRAFTKLRSLVIFMGNIALAIREDRELTFEEVQEVMRECGDEGDQVMQAARKHIFDICA